MKTLAILTADIHLRDDNPRCRTDNFLATQIDKLLWLSEIQKQYKCPILDAGDLFHKWKTSPHLLNIALKYMPSNFFTVIGNHDLPQHNMELINQSGLGVLLQAGKINTLVSRTKFDNFITYAFGWGTPIVDVQDEETLPKIAIMHTMTYKGNKPYAQCNDLDAESLLRKYKGYDVILTGHNHKFFIEEYKNRILVNAGSLTRQASDQIDYKPAVHLLQVEDGEFHIESLPVPIRDNVISNTHTVSKAEIDERMGNFTEALNQECTMGISYETNIDNFCANNNVEEKVVNILLKEMGR